MRHVRGSRYIYTYYNETPSPLKGIIMSNKNQTLTAIEFISFTTSGLVAQSLVTALLPAPVTLIDKIVFPIGRYCIGVAVGSNVGKAVTEEFSKAFGWQEELAPSSSDE